MHPLPASAAWRCADDHLLRFQLGELRIVEAGFAQHLVGVFAEPRRRPAHRGRCAREARRRPHADDRALGRMLPNARTTAPPSSADAPAARRSCRCAWPRCRALRTAPGTARSSCSCVTLRHVVVDLADAGVAFVAVVEVVLRRQVLAAGADEELAPLRAAVRQHRDVAVARRRRPPPARQQPLVARADRAAARRSGRPGARPA